MSIEPGLSHILNSRTLHSSPESGESAGYDGAKGKKGSKLHLAVETQGHLLALHVTPASADDRAVGRSRVGGNRPKCDPGLCRSELHGRAAKKAAEDQEITLDVVKLPEATKGFVLLPRRWVVERSFIWATRFRRLIKGDERYASTVAGLHTVAFVCITLRNVACLSTSQ